jgi:AraC-like DNA-binding protein
MKSKKPEIPSYKLDKFKPVHRHSGSTSLFGYNNIDKAKVIDGFEIYSSDGLISSMGPLKSEFYRVSITVTGTLNMQIGLESYQHVPCTICFTYPNQIFSKNNISADTFGYYILFKADFLDEVIPMLQIPREFPFYDISGTPLFQLAQDELNTIVSFVLKINEELHACQSGRIKAIKMYLYLILLEARRCYERQQFHPDTITDSQTLVSRFRRLVGLHYLTKRQVSDYAQMLSVSPNHLNRMIKNNTGQTASEIIKDMLLLEAKSLLKYTDSSIAEIAYQLDFSDPASFNRFFRKITAETPLAYRSAHS